jgi:hypothetical protein
MPGEGETCTKLATYKSACCDVERVIGAGARFPRCPNHPDRPTLWTLLLEPVRNKKSDTKRKN